MKSVFDSVRHDVVLDALARIVKDRRARVLALCAVVLRGPPQTLDVGVGLPIGALTSQWSRPENKRRYEWRLRYRWWPLATSRRGDGSHLRAVASVQ